MTGEDLDDNEEIREKRAMEQLEDLMGGVSTGVTGTTGTSKGEKRPTPGEVAALSARLDVLGAAVGVVLDPQRS